MKTRTKEQIEKGSELLQALSLIFYPFVEAALRPMMTALMSQPPPKLELTEEEIDALCEAARLNSSDDGLSEEELDKGAAEMKKFLLNPRPLTPDEIEEAVKEEAQIESTQMVRNWLNAYFYADADANGNRTVPISRIDDAMLPPLDFVLSNRATDAQTGEQLFAECCNMSLDAEATRVVLRQVKAMQPFGWPMPLEAVAFLKLEGIAIVP